MKKSDGRLLSPGDEGQPMLGLLLAIPMSIFAWLVIGGAVRLFW